MKKILAFFIVLTAGLLFTKATLAFSGELNPQHGNTYTYTGDPLPGGAEYYVYWGCCYDVNVQGSSYTSNDSFDFNPGYWWNASTQAAQIDFEDLSTGSIHTFNITMQPYYDLYPQNLSVSPSGPTNTQTVSVAADITNSVSSVDYIPLSTAGFGIYNSDYSSLIRYDLPSTSAGLAAGASQHYSYSGLGPFSAGTYHFCAVADWYNNLAEFNENNNRSCVDFTVQNPSPPSASLNISGNQPAGFSGVARTSGNTSSNNGKDWNNPINVSVSGQANNGAQIKGYYAQLSPGVYVGYKPNSGDNSVMSGCSSNYCVNNGGWTNIADQGTPVGNTYVYHGSSSNWTIYFNPGFGNQHITTCGYTEDTNGLWGKDGDSSCASPPPSP